jgi:hypothetical protein
MHWARKRDRAFAGEWDRTLENRRLTGAGAIRSRSGSASKNHIGSKQSLSQCSERAALAPHRAPALLSKSTAKRFLLALSRDGNVTHACRAAGVERGSVYRQRQRCPKFRTVWDETVAGAYHHLEMALVGAAATVADDSAGDNKAAFGGMSAALGVQLLRLHRTKVMQTDGGSEDELPTIEAVRDEVLARLDAIRRHRARENGGEDSNDVEAGHGE